MIRIQRGLENLGMWVMGISPPTIQDTVCNEYFDGDDGDTSGDEGDTAGDDGDTAGDTAGDAIACVRVPVPLRSLTIRRADMIHWKYMWNDVIGDPDFRAWIARSELWYYDVTHVTRGGNAAHVVGDVTRVGNAAHVVGDVTHGGNAAHVVGDVTRVGDICVELVREGDATQRGTLHVTFGDVAHYVSFRMDTARGCVVVFDPSHGNGTFSGCLPPYIEAIERHFGRPVHMDTFYGTPQQHAYDTFCQTWSLAYHIKSARKRLVGARSAARKRLVGARSAARAFCTDTPRTYRTGTIKQLYHTCKLMIRTRAFREVCEDQTEWVDACLRRNRAPQKWDAEYFYNVSRFMRLEHFATLFEK